MLKRKIVFVLLFLLVVGSLIGCSNQNTGAETVANQEKSNEYFPLTIKDETGAEISIPKEPKRIISLIPSITETLYELGFGDRVIGVTINDTYPENVQKNAEYVFKDGLNPNIEQILNLNPDLIIMGPFNREETDKIRNLNIPAVKFDPQNLDEVYQMIENLGKITDSNEQAKDLVLNMKIKVEDINNTVANIKNENKKRVWVELSSDLWTAGKGTFIDEIVTKAGGINITEETSWVQYSEENVIAKNPNAILVTYSNYDSNAVRNIEVREGWEKVDAIKNNQIIAIDSDLVSRPGPRVVIAIQEIAQKLYPNLFK